MANYHGIVNGSGIGTIAERLNAMGIELSVTDDCQRGEMALRKGTNYLGCYDAATAAATFLKEEIQPQSMPMPTVVEAEDVSTENIEAPRTVSVERKSRTPNTGAIVRDRANGKWLEMGKPTERKALLAIRKECLHELISDGYNSGSCSVMLSNWLKSVNEGTNLT